MRVREAVPGKLVARTKFSFCSVTRNSNNPKVPGAGEQEIKKAVNDRLFRARYHSTRG
jgi:hypothetical protein